MKLIYIAVIFRPKVCSTRGREWKAIGEMSRDLIKSKITNPFLKELFLTASSNSLKRSKCSI